MTYIIYLFFLCLVFWLCFADYKGYISDKLLCVFMFPLMVFITTIADKEAYVMLYQRINSLADIGLTDPGFGLLMYISNALGLNYTGFLAFLAIIGFVLLIISLKKISVCPAIVLAFYFVLVFPVFTIQLRSFIAEMILYIMIVDMVNAKNFQIKRFLFLLILSILFHAASFFFILLLLVMFVKSRRKLLCLVALAMSAVPAAASILSYVPIPMIQQKIQYYLLFNRETISGAAIFLVVAYIFTVGIIYLIMRTTRNEEWHMRLDRLLKINLIGMIAGVLILIFSSNFYRMIRVIIMVDIIVLSSKYFQSHHVCLKERTIMAGLFIALFIGKQIATNELFNLAIHNSFLSSFLGLI